MRNYVFETLAEYRQRLAHFSNANAATESGCSTSHYLTNGALLTLLSAGDSLFTRCCPMLLTEAGGGNTEETPHYKGSTYVFLSNTRKPATLGCLHFLNMLVLD